MEDKVKTIITDLKCKHYNINKSKSDDHTERELYIIDTELRDIETTIENLESIYMV